MVENAAVRHAIPMDHNLENKPSNPGRRRLLALAGRRAAALTIAALMGAGDKGQVTPPSDPSLFRSETVTIQPQERESALRAIAGFMETYTQDRTVTEFLVSNPSSKTLESVVTQTQTLSPKKERVKAWNIVLSGARITYTSEKNNPEGALPKGYQELTVQLQRDGTLAKEGISSPISFTKDDEKKALEKFISPTAFPQSDKWDTHTEERGGKGYETEKTHKTEKTWAVATIKESGEARIQVVANPDTTGPYAQKSSQ